MSKPRAKKVTPPDAVQDDDVVLAFHDVSLGYDFEADKHDPALDNSDTFILKSLNFQLPAGSFHFLTGPSGAGKTSLLKMIYLAQKPTRGSISLFGEEIMPQDRQQSARLRRKIGIVFQEFRLLDHLNVFDNAALPLFVHGQTFRTY